MNEFWKTLKCTRILYPPDLTHVLQAIDRHIGIKYKKDVYRAIRAETMKHIRSGKEAKDIGMTPSAKRILVTKIVADTHECLAKRNSFERSFIATGT